MQYVRKASLFNPGCTSLYPTSTLFCLLRLHNAPSFNHFTSGRGDFVETRGHVYIRVRLALALRCVLLLGSAFAAALATADVRSTLRDAHELPPPSVVRTAPHSGFFRSGYCPAWHTQQQQQQHQGFLPQLL
jgi:hypothetical protein